MGASGNREKIIEAARRLLESGGVGAVSFDAIAAEVGIAKQSVLYWYPSRSDLLAALFVGWLAAETEAAEASLVGVKDSHAAIEAFVRTIIRFHTGDFDRFRLMYLAPQTMKSGIQEVRNTDVLGEIHATTSMLYSALAARLDGSSDENRESAFAIHASALGIVMMLGLADSIGDPLKHSEQRLIDALVSRLSNHDRGANEGDR